MKQAIFNPKIMSAMRPKQMATICTTDGAGNVISQVEREIGGEVRKAIRIDYARPIKPILYNPNAVARSAEYAGMHGELSTLENGMVSFKTLVKEQGKKLSKTYLFSTEEAFKSGRPCSIRTWDENGKLVNIMHLDYKPIPEYKIKHRCN